jgi:hypothetical protein
MARPLGAAARREWRVVVDLTVTGRLRVALVSADGEVGAEREEALPARGAADALADLAGTLEYGGAARVAVVAVPDVLRQGVALTDPHLVHRLLGLPACVVAEHRLRAVAEARFGAGAGARRVLYVGATAVVAVDGGEPLERPDWARAESARSAGRTPSLAVAAPLAEAAAAHLVAELLRRAGAAIPVRPAMLGDEAVLLGATSRRLVAPLASVAG